MSYSRAARSSLIGTLSFTRQGQPVMTTTRTHDYVGRLTSIATVTAQAGTLSSTSYRYNAANQREHAAREDGAAWLYGYDALGQLTTASKRLPDGSPLLGQQYGYDFDQIGNRQTTTVNGRVATYSANLLNQYGSRTVPGAATSREPRIRKFRSR